MASSAPSAPPPAGPAPAAGPAIPVEAEVYLDAMQRTFCSGRFGFDRDVAGAGLDGMAGYSLEDLIAVQIAEIVTQWSRWDELADDLRRTLPPRPPWWGEVESGYRLASPELQESGYRSQLVARRR